MGIEGSPAEQVEIFAEVSAEPVASVLAGALALAVEAVEASVLAELASVEAVAPDALAVALVA